MPEYPELAWLEGIVNAVTHREYAYTGAYILVSMYDDHLEIESPGLYGEQCYCNKGTIRSSYGKGRSSFDKTFK